jgi:hypothetical protein
MVRALAETEKLTDFKRNPTYERRVVGCYDFLGWQSHIDEAGLAPANLGTLRRIILRHSRMLGVKTDLEIRSSTFSDNVVITQAPGSKTQMLMQHLANVQLGSTLVGFLVRGGITVGNVVHDDESVFGPGLNRAYQLEKEGAKFPRIVLDPLVKKEFENIGDIAVIENGVRFLDPFRPAYCEHLKGAGYESAEAVSAAGLPAPKGVFKDFAKDVLDMILETLNEQLQKPMDDEVFQKVSWLYDRIATQVRKPISSTRPRISDAWAERNASM